MSSTDDKLRIYVDGACSGNPGPGGWAAIIEFNDKSVELSGAENNTTNNRMELLSIISALSEIKVSSEITVVSDSKYLVEGMTKWLNLWKNKGWKTAGKDEVKNLDLWQELDKLASRHKISWEWIQGHKGHEKNERCDKLAKLALKGLDS